MAYKAVQFVHSQDKFLLNVLIASFVLGYFPSPFFHVYASVSLDKTTTANAFAPSQDLGKSCAKRVWNGGKTHFGEPSVC